MTTRANEERAAEMTAAEVAAALILAEHQFTGLYRQEGYGQESKKFYRCRCEESVPNTAAHQVRQLAIAGLLASQQDEDVAGLVQGARADGVREGWRQAHERIQQAIDDLHQNEE